MVLRGEKSTDLNDKPPQVDDLLLCGACGTVNCVCLLGTREFTYAEMQQLAPEEKRDLDFAVRAVQRRIKQN